jgi:hypothetical protein
MDIERCTQCGGKLKIIAVIEQPEVIARILTHIGLSPQPPPRAPARRVDLFQGASRKFTSLTVRRAGDRLRVGEKWCLKFLYPFGVAQRARVSGRFSLLAPGSKMEYAI